MNRGASSKQSLPANLDQIYRLAEQGDADSLLERLRAGGLINFVHPTSTDSPLMIACRKGHVDVVKICLDFGAKNDPHPDFGQTALHAAVASGRLPCAANILHVAQLSDADVVISNLTDQFGQTPLHTACLIGSVQLAELLLHHGARISSIDTYGQTPLHLCAGSGHKSVLAVLLDHGGDLFIDLPDVYGNSPLHHAAYHGKLECAKLLLETAANANARNNEGLTAYNLAVIHGHQQISAVVLEYRNDGSIDRFSRDSTPKQTYYSADSPYGTPMTSNPLELAIPNLRRSQTYGGAESSALYDQLPRPHTVASPNIANKINRTKPNGSPRLAHLYDRERANSSPYSDSALPDKRERDDYTNDDALETVREKRSSQTVSSASQDDRFVETPTKMFNGPKIVPPLVTYTSTPNRKANTALKKPTSTYSISSDSDGDDIVPAITPSRKSPIKEDYQSYAEPIEIFDAYDMTWYVYMTENGDIYYLDATSSHSQWDDPRQYGIINYDDQAAYDSNNEVQYSSSPSKNSPSKMSDTAPPRTPTLRSPSTQFNEHFASQEEDSHHVRSLFGDEEDTTVEVRSLRTPSHSVEERSNSSLFSDSPDVSSLPYEPISKSNVNTLKQQFQKNNNDNNTILMKENDSKEANTKLFVKAERKSVAPIIQREDSSMNNFSCDEYLALLKQGKSLQDIRTLLEQSGYSRIMISKIMTTLDECLMLDVEDMENNDNDTEKLRKEKQKEEESKLSDTERMKLKLKLVQESHPTLNKYAKMVQMGVLPMSVISKMKLDNVEAHYIDLMEDALGIHDEQHSKKLAGQNGRQNMDTWLPEEKLKNSIWAFAPTDNTLLADQELAELESMFRTQRESRSRNIAVPDKAIKKLVLQVLEGKRAQNISIGLVQFKSIGSHVDILKAICSLNSLDNNITVDNLENLKSLLPTDSEVKLMHRLNHPTHPSEMFYQVVMLFYPELPFRLSTFITCLGFHDYANNVEKKLRIIMNAMNQILSSTKLAKILQKLLVAGRVMMQPGAGSKASKLVTSDAKTSVLEQLLQVSNMKSVDKKTSLMDYVVKTLYDKSEESLLLVIEDLSLLGDNTAPLNSTEILQDLKQIDKQMEVLKQELLRARSLSSVQEIFSSPTAKAISDEYTVQLQEYINTFEEHAALLRKRKVLLLKKLQALMEYFGEDKKETDSSRIFIALKEFRRVLMFSKESIEWKLHRSQQQPQQLN